MGRRLFALDALVVQDWTRAHAPGQADVKGPASRLGLPIRPLIGEEYRRMMAEDDARRHALWQRRP
jgi:hypothetical protein